VATTHLKAKEKFEDIRHTQAKQLVKAFGEGENHIICGDFNDVPDSKPL
jgi:endonuclease/exonuclease/phosphatase family metal-dependent hydrolase